jgi:hypothetical protein
MVATGILLNISRHTSSRASLEPQASIRAARRAPWSLSDALGVWWQDRRPAAGAGRRRSPAGVAGRGSRKARRT